MVGDQDLVPGRERDVGQRDGDRVGHVGDEREQLRPGAEGLGEPGPGRRDPPGQVREEAVRIRLLLLVQPPLELLDRDRDGAEGPVVEVDHRRVQREQPFGPGQRFGGLDGRRGLGHCGPPGVVSGPGSGGRRPGVLLPRSRDV